MDGQRHVLHVKLIIIVVTVVEYFPDNLGFLRDFSPHTLVLRSQQLPVFGVCPAQGELRAQLLRHLLSDWRKAGRQTAFLIGLCRPAKASIVPQSETWVHRTAHLG